MSNDALELRSECLDAHGGETFMRLQAFAGGRLVGYIDFSLYAGDVHVKYIHVVAAERRHGIATAMARRLQAEHPQAEVRWGMSTDEGSAFLHHLPRRFTPNPRYAELTAQLAAAARTEHARITKEFEEEVARAARHPGAGLSPELAQKGDRINELSNDIYRLEEGLRDEPQGRWIVLQADQAPTGADRLDCLEQTLAGHTAPAVIPR